MRKLKEMFLAVAGKGGGEMNEVLQGLNGAEMAVSDTGVPFLYFRRLAAQKGVRHGCSTRAVVFLL